jgi:flagellar hook-associated protein 3 FlgL
MSTRITQAMIARATLSDLQQSADRLSRTQRKLASGQEITRPSDDPYGTSRALNLRTELEGQRQLQRNVQDGQGWLTVTDTALSQVTDVVQRARELLVSGASDSAGPTARNAMADEVDQLVESLKQASNAAYGGRYVFSGTATQTAPYAVGGADAYAGNGATVAREIGPNVSVAINFDAHALLGDGQSAGDGLLLDNLRDISQHLRGGTTADATALRGTDLRALDANLQNVLRVRAQVGALANRLESAGSRLAQLEETTTALLSQVEDADMAKTITDYSTQQSAYQSALRAGANIVQSSLLDFLR